MEASELIAAVGVAMDAIAVPVVVVLSVALVALVADKAVGYVRGMLR